MSHQKENKRSNSRSQWMRYVSLGTELLVILALAVWFGIWLDKKLDVSPLFLVVLPLIGLVVVFTRLIRNLNK
jgi:F0F1-type ATP synthase assembly protein I